MHFIAKSLWKEQIARLRSDAPMTLRHLAGCMCILGSAFAVARFSLAANGPMRFVGGTRRGAHASGIPNFVIRSQPDQWKGLECLPRRSGMIECSSKFRYGVEIFICYAFHRDQG